MTSTERLLSVALLFLLAASTPLANERSEKDLKEKSTPSKTPLKDHREKLEAQFQELQKASQELPGLLPIHQDQRNGSVYLALSPQHLESELLLFSHAENGVPPAGQFRGRFH
ncbi:MAG: hypothetical protein AAF191_14280, partial [Verrucomicrobiota bacterium]